MRFGLFGRFPLRFGGGRPEAQRIYEAMRDNRGERFGKADDGDENRTLRCAARAIAVAASYQRRGANQSHVSLATDSLPKWERLLGIPRDPRDTDADRRALGTAILAGNGQPTYDQIVTALRSALGETVSIVAATPTRKAAGATVAYNLTGSLITGSDFTAGLHFFGCAFETATEMRVASAVSASLTAGQGIRTNPVPLSTVTGAIRVHYYVSTSAGVAGTSMAWVASNTGEAIDLLRYPRNPGTPGLHHLAIVVSAAAWADSVKRARAHAVLGPMLPSWVTYDLVLSSPFLLGVSLLGEGAL